MVEVDARSFRGYRPLRNENPRMGVRGVAWGRGRIGPLNRTMKISCTPNPGSGIPISEFRIPYGVWGILEYRTMRSWDRGSRARRARAGVTGWDIGCRTLRCYVNSGVGHWVSDGGGNLGKCDKREVTSGQTRKERLAH
jgi:hypothetical protein